MKAPATPNIPPAAISPSHGMTAITHCNGAVVTIIIGANKKLSGDGPRIEPNAETTNIIAAPQSEYFLTMFMCDMIPENNVIAIGRDTIISIMLKESEIGYKTLLPHVLLALHTLGGAGNPKQVIDTVANDLNLSEEFLNRETRKTNSSSFEKSVHFSRLRLVWAEYIDNSERGKWILTKKAKDKISELRDEKSHSAFAEEVFEESEKERIKRKEKNKENSLDAETNTVFRFHDEHHDEEKDVEQDLEEETKQAERELDIIQNITPEQFERLCAILFEKAGYVDVVNTQLSRDGGYDGKAFYLFGLTKIKVVFESKRYRDATIDERKIKQLE